MAKRDGSKRAAKYEQEKCRYRQFSTNKLLDEYLKLSELLVGENELRNVSIMNWQREGIVVRRAAIISVLMERENDPESCEALSTKILKADMEADGNAPRHGEIYGVLTYNEDYVEDENESLFTYAYGKKNNLEGSVSAERAYYDRHTDLDGEAVDMTIMKECYELILEVVGSERLIKYLFELSELQLVCLVYRSIYQMSNLATARKLGMRTDITSKAYRAAINKISSKMTYRECFE